MFVRSERRCGIGRGEDKEGLSDRSRYRCGHGAAHHRDNQLLSNFFSSDFLRGPAHEDQDYVETPHEDEYSHRQCRLMAEQLAGGNQAIALLGNTIPTGAILIVIITIFGPVSGAHFNPAVTLVFAARGDTPWVEVIPYIVVQCVGAILGTVLAHLMFELAPLVIGIKERSGPSQWLAEAVATFTLVITILGGLRHAPTAIPWLVGLVITAAYWFTASTSFANPAVTLARVSRPRSLELRSIMCLRLSLRSLWGPQLA
jgi:hypothetical protein